MKRLAGVGLGIVLLAQVARADEYASSPARPDWDHSTNLLSWDGRKRTEDLGLVIDGSYTVDSFYAPQLTRKLTLTGMFTVEIDPSLDKLVHEALGRAHIQAHAIHGDSPTSELMDVYGVSGNAAPQDVRLFEAWYEQPLGPLTIRAGLLGVDQEYNYADATQTLLGATFGITSQFSYNVGGPAYPAGALGVSARFERGKVLLQAAVYDGTATNTRGIPTAIGPETLAIGEATWDHDYGIGAWHHTEKGSGLYGTFDHRLGERVEGFSRIGLSPEGLRTYLDAGVRVGPGVAGAEDFINMGLAFSRLDDGDQVVVEATYEAAIGWFTIQPDLQLMMLRDRTVGIVATRMTVVF